MPKAAFVIWWVSRQRFFGVQAEVLLQAEVLSRQRFL